MTFSFLFFSFLNIFPSRFSLHISAPAVFCWPLANTQKLHCEDSKANFVSGSISCVASSFKKLLKPGGGANLFSGLHIHFAPTPAEEARTGGWGDMAVFVVAKKK